MTNLRSALSKARSAHMHGTPKALSCVSWFPIHAGSPAPQALTNNEQRTTASDNERNNRGLRPLFVYFMVSFPYFMI
jgi:hypothetical protein